MNLKGKLLKSQDLELKQDCFSDRQFHVAGSSCKLTPNSGFLPPSSKMVKNIVYKDTL